MVMRIGAGMPSTRAVESCRKEASNPEMGRPEVKTRAAPRAMLIMPRVAMKGGRRPLVMRSPLSHAGEGEQRPDREVDAAGQDHEGHAQRDHRVDAGLLHHVEQVRDGEEMRGEDGEEAREDDETDEGAQLPRPAGGGMR